MRPAVRGLLLALAGIAPLLAGALWLMAPLADVDTGHDVIGADGVREIRLRAHAWGFSPAVVHVSHGEMVRFRVASDDIKHGFAISELDINLLLAPDTEMRSPTRTITLSDGIYSIQCTAFCGMGHAAMKAKLVVGTARERRAWAPWIFSAAALVTLVVAAGAGPLRRAGRRA